MSLGAYVRECMGAGPPDDHSQTHAAYSDTPNGSIVGLRAVTNKTGLCGARLRVSQIVKHNASNSFMSTHAKKFLKIIDTFYLKQNTKTILDVY